MPGWNDYAKTATPTEGGDFPEIDDGVYAAMIADVGEPEEREGQFGHQVQFKMKWELEDFAKPNGDAIWLWQWVTLPEGYLEKGNLGKKSNLYALMKALGFDVDAPNVDINPPSWQGMSARIMVVNKGTRSDPAAVRPRIDDVLPKVAKGKGTMAPRQPVAAGVEEPPF